MSIPSCRLTAVTPTREQFKPPIGGAKFEINMGVAAPRWPGGLLWDGMEGEKMIKNRKSLDLQNGFLSRRDINPTGGEAC